MDALGIFAPLLFIMGVYWALSKISRTLAEIVTIAIVVWPIIWSLLQLKKMGKDIFHPSSWIFLFSRLLILIPAALTVYLFRSERHIWGLLSLFVYSIFAQGAWVETFRSFGMAKPGSDDDDLVRRGSRVVDAKELNARTKAESKEASGSDVQIGGVTIPRRLEAQHFLVSGTTGAGKTQVINGMLRTIRSRAERSVVADPAGGFYARFGRPGDILLNPFDKRSVAWSPFAEIKQDYDCERIARAIIPDLETSGDGAQWQLFAQTLLAKSMLSLHRQGNPSTKELLRLMNSADQRELAPLLDGTPAGVLTQKGNDKMLNNTRATMVPYLSVLEYLPDDGKFSIRDWVREEWRDNWLFITYRDDQMALLRNLVATGLEMAIVEGLSLTENQDRALWYVMDEVDSLGKVSSLKGGLTKLRKYGGRCVLGLQTVAQLRTTYGRDEAQTLIANTSVKCILRAGDAETAKSMEHELGEQEIERLQVNDSFTSNQGGSSQSQSMSTQVVRQSTVLASEVMGLADLEGFLKIPGDEIARIKVDYVAMPDINPAFQ